MSDLAAPAAPVAPANGAPRNNSGQFAPKAGATGVAPAEGAAPAADGAPPSGPQSVEEWSFEGEYDAPGGEKRKVQYKSKAEAIRAAQELEWHRKTRRDAVEAEKRARYLLEQAPVEEILQARGLSLEEEARKRVLKAAKEIDMSPEQRELEDLRAYKAQQAEREQQERKTHEERQQQAQRQAQRQRAVAGLEKGLELSGLPRTHSTMGLLAEIQHEATAQGLPELPPDLLAAEANKRYTERGIEPLKKLQGKSLLDRLGPDVVRAVLMAERERRGLAASTPRQSSAPSHELPASTDDKVYGEAEAEAKLRALRNGR